MISLAQKWHSVHQKWRSDKKLWLIEIPSSLWRHTYLPRLGSSESVGTLKSSKSLDHFSIETYSMVTSGSIILRNPHLDMD